MTPHQRLPCTFAVALLCLAGTGLAASPEHQLRVAINTDIRSTNPGVNRDANTDTIIHHMVESLVAYGEDLQVKPLLAESIAISDDGRSYRFRLRPGVVFHNGTALTASHVVWNWRRFLDPATQWQCRRWYTDDNDDPSTSIIVDVRSEQSDTVVFELLQPNALFLDQMANVQCPSAIVHPDSVDADGNWIEPIGTGPYRLAEWRRGEYVELRRFDQYHTPNGDADGFVGGKKAHATSVRFLISPDHASTKAALQSGGIDVYPGVPMNSLTELAAENDIQLLSTPVLGWTALLVQTDDDLLRDPRMRRAIAHAIDREQIVGFNTYGHASVNSSPVPVADPMHTAVHDEWYEPSREKAVALLKEIGYHGQIVEIQTNRKYSNMYDNAVVIQAMLHAVGINARLQVMDWATQLANYYSGKFQLSAFSFSALANPTLRYIKIIGSKDVRATYQWDNPRANDLLAGLLTAYTAEQRSAAYDELQRLMRNEVPIIGLYNAHSVTALRSDVVGYRQWSMSMPLFWGVSKLAWTDQD
jgi:peptide/nickel transport system substrate-binding protein